MESTRKPFRKSGKTERAGRKESKKMETLEVPQISSREITKEHDHSMEVREKERERAVVLRRQNADLPPFFPTA